MTAPGYALSFTLDNNGGAPVGTTCIASPGGPVGPGAGFGHFTITATPLIPTGRYFMADTNSNPPGKIQYHDGVSGTWNPYVLALQPPYQLTVVTNNVAPQPTTPPNPINDTILPCGTLTSACGTVSFAGPNNFTCFPVASGVQTLNFGNPPCASTLSGALGPGGHVPANYETAVGANGAYSTFSFTLLASSFNDGPSVGHLEILRVSLYDLTNGVQLATCDIPGQGANDPNGTPAVSPYTFCSNPLTQKPNPGDFLGVVVYTPTCCNSGNFFGGVDAFNFTVL